MDDDCDNINDVSEDEDNDGRNMIMMMKRQFIFTILFKI